MTKGVEGARYVLEGNLRHAGGQVRAALKLIDTASGANLWAENYTRPFAPGKVFEIQDELTPVIVSAVGDLHGVLPRSMCQALRGRKPEDLTPYEAVLRSFGYTELVTPEELSSVRVGLLRAVEQEPDYADAWARLSALNGQDYGQGFDLVPDALAQSTAAARRAVELAPSSYMAWSSLAQALFFERQRENFRNAAERAVALNPNDADNLAFMGELLFWSGETGRGRELSAAARRLKPTHAGWYWYTDLFDQVQRRDFQAAAVTSGKIELEGHWFLHAARAAIRGHLGEQDAAAKAVARLRELRPNIAREFGPVMRRWWSGEQVELFLEGLRKAGLFDEAPAAAAPQATAADSSSTRAEEGFWVAVLPLRASNAELKALAEGMFEEIVAGFSRFSYLRVVSQASTLRYAGQVPDVRVAAKELGARFIMDGSLRQAGSRLRVTIGLTDSATGKQLWVETYERAFNSDAVFEILDDLVPRIVSTYADPYGVLARSISDSVRSKSAVELTPYEALLRGFGYHQRLTPEEHSAARDALEHAVENDPANSDCWSMLAWVYAHEYAHGFNPLPGSLDRSLSAARRAVDLAPANHLAHQALCTALFFRKETTSALHEADRAIELNPVDGGSNAAMGAMLAFAGNWDRGIALIERAMALNAQYPFWCRSMLAFNEFRQGKYQAAVAALVQSNAPDVFWTQMFLAACYGHMGESAAAGKALEYMIRLRPELSSMDGAAAHAAKWFQKDTAEMLLAGLGKAGLGGAPEPGSSSAPSIIAPASIAVLPFANLSADKEQEYFSDGLAEEIINLLAQVPGLKVIARTSSFAFRGKEQDIRKIAGALDVTHILEGSVRRAGDRIRVAAQLIAASDGAHVWSERFDRQLSDLFEVQDEISAAITGTLRLKLSVLAAPQRYMPNVPAYEAYLKAKYHLAKNTPESIELTRQYYEQAIALDPAFASAYCGLGFYWLSMTTFGRCPTGEAVAKGRAEARRALEIDPSLAEAHALLGYLAAMYDLDWTTAERHFSYPQAREAGWVVIQPLYAGFQFACGNYSRAIELSQRSIEKNPLEIWPHMNLHAFLQAVGRDAEAMEQLKKVLELDPGQVIALVSFAMLQADRGDFASAMATAKHAHAIGSWSPDTAGVLAAFLRRDGQESESRVVLETIGTGEALGDARARAVYHLLCGEIDEGADWTEKAIEERDLSMMYYVRFVVSKGLRASHRWGQIKRMLNLE